ncbi:MAG TPA: bacillithiol biosynthesis cysteine-adding enzyme BshC [bacterium]|nr:bacillithiol biosynthesis cysteine-adding enzyme BshC [bacterium]
MATFRKIAIQDNPGHSPLARAADMRLAANLRFPSIREIEPALKTRRDYFSAHIHRETLSRELTEDHQRRGAPPESIRSAQKLAESDTCLVITGQQPGLLLGPLYTLFKCIQAVNLAHEWTRQGYGTVLPAFWNASEDHDRAEIDHAIWLDRDRQPVRYQVGLENLPQNLCVSAIPKAKVDLPGLIARVKQTVGHEPHCNFISSWIEESFSRSGDSLADWFDHLLWSLLPQSGLLIIRPEWAWLRSAAQPVLMREIENPTLAADEVNRAGKALIQVGLAQQIHKPETRASFFLLRNGCREAVHLEEPGFRTEEGERFTKEDLLRRLEKHPGDFSGNAILRPLIQDACLPTVATILGPGEALYHLQLGGLYARHHIPRPILVPRAGATFLEQRDKRILEKTGLSLADFSQEPKALVRMVIGRAGVEDSRDSCEHLKNEIEKTYQRLKDIADSIDPTVTPAVEKQRYQILQTVEKTENLLIRKKADREEILHRQIDSVGRAVRPLGQPQERVLYIVQFLARHGPDWVQDLGNALDSLQPGSHAIFVLS